MTTNRKDEIQRELGWALRDRVSGKLIGLDRQSGGYPWLPDRASEVKIFASDMEAESYIGGARWKSLGYDLTVERVERVIRELGK